MHTFSAEQFSRDIRSNNFFHLTERYKNAKIRGRVIVAGRTIPNRVRLEGVQFDSVFDGEDAIFGNSLEFFNCVFSGGLHIAGARINGSLRIKKCDIFPVQERERKVIHIRTHFGEADVALSMVDSEVRQTVSLSASTLHGAAACSSTQIGGRLILDEVDVAGEFRATSSTIGDDVLCRSSKRHGERLSRFREFITFDGAKVGGDLDFKGCVIGETKSLVMVPPPKRNNRKGSFIGRQMTVQGHVAFSRADQSEYPTVLSSDFDLERSRIHGGVHVYGILVRGNIDLARAHVSGGVFTARVRRSGYMTPRSASVSTTRIAGSLILLNTVVDGNVVASNLKIGEDLILEEARVRGSLLCCARSHTGRDCEKGGAPFEVQRPLIRQSIRMSRARIEGDVDFCGVRVPGRLTVQTGDHPPEILGGDLVASGAVIGNSFVCRAYLPEEDRSSAFGTDDGINHSEGVGPVPEFGGDVHLNDIRVQGSIDLCGISVGKDVYGKNLVVDGNFLCHGYKVGQPSPIIGGVFDISYAKISGKMTLSGASIAKDALLWGVQIGHALFATNRYIPRSVVFLRPADAGVSGSTERQAGVANAGSVTRVGGRLILARVTVGGDVYGNNICAERRVDFDGAEIRGRTMLMGAAVKGRFTALEAVFHDGLYLGRADDTVPWEADDAGPARIAAIDLSHTVVGSTLHLTGLQVTAGLATSSAVDERLLDGDYSMRMRFTEVRGACQFPNGTEIPRIDLFHAQLGDIAFDGDMPMGNWDGVSFRHCPLDLAQVLCLLDNGEFHQSVYQRFESHFREQGLGAQADTIYLEMMRRERRVAIAVYSHAIVHLDIYVTEWFARGRVRYDRLQKMYSNQLSGTGRGDGATSGDDKKRGRLLSAFSGFVGWASGMLWDVATAYGTRSHRVGSVLALVFVISMVLCWNDESVQRSYEPTMQELAMADLAAGGSGANVLEPVVSPGDIGKEWGLGDAFAMALRITFPFVEIAIDTDWQPSGRVLSVIPLAERGLGIRVAHSVRQLLTYEMVAGCMQLLSGVLFPVFLVSVSGVFRRRGES